MEWNEDEKTLKSSVSIVSGLECDVLGGYVGLQDFELAAGAKAAGARSCS